MNPAAFDLVLRNARVATASDCFDADIGITGGRIVQLSPPEMPLPPLVDAVH